MNALIKTQDGFYCSTVFAIYNNPRKMAVVVFDESISQLIIKNCFEKTGISKYTMNVCIANDNRDNWVENKKWHGFDFLVNNEKLLNSIKRYESIDEGILNKCKALQTTETFSGWNDINTEADIKILMNFACDFHDSTLRSVKTDGNDTYIKFFGCGISLKFSNMVSSDTGIGISWGNNAILEANMCFENGNIKWYVNHFAFEEYENQKCYFIAEKAQYKIDYI